MHGLTNKIKCFNYSYSACFISFRNRTTLIEKPFSSNIHLFIQERFNQDTINVSHIEIFIILYFNLICLMTSHDVILLLIELGCFIEEIFLPYPRLKGLHIHLSHYFILGTIGLVLVLYSMNRILKINIDN